MGATAYGGIEALEGVFSEGKHAIRAKRATRTERKALRVEAKSRRPTSRHYTTSDLCSMLGVDASTIRRWADSGKLKCFRTLGGHRRYAPETLWEFIETHEYNVPFTLAELEVEKKPMGDTMIDFHVLKEDHHTLQEVCFSYLLKGDSESLTQLLIDCDVRAGISPAVIFDEIVLKTIRRIKNCGSPRKLSQEQKDEAINAILESFARSRGILRTSA